MSHNNTESLNRIVPHLIMNYPSLSDTGLLHGRMGGVLFFSLYSRHTEKEFFGDYAFELLESVLDSISKNTPIGFAYGLAGVGWGGVNFCCKIN